MSQIEVEFLDPKDQIEDIKRRYTSADRDFVMASLNRSIDRIEKAFPRYGSFLMEFIQNADDVASKTIVIQMLENSIRVFNDGRSFSSKDVNSICKIGMSTKTPEDYIGYLGVGFKSVFLMSESPKISSAGYRFKFDRNAWPDKEFTPWQLIPVWMDEFTIPDSDFPAGHRTAFDIPVKNAALMQTLQRESASEQISNRILLFLRYLQTIVVQSLSTKRRIERFSHRKTDDYEIYLILEQINGEMKTKEYWLVFRETVLVPQNVREDQVTKDWERENVKKREVVAAFRLDPDENLIIEERGTAHAGVFSFLPLKEVESGLNFLIQADFLTTAGRGDFARDCLWNNWLGQEIYKLITEKAIPVLKKNEKWRLNYTDILHSRSGGHEIFEKNIKTPLAVFLENEANIVAEDGSFVPLRGALVIDDQIRNVVSTEHLKSLYPDKKPIDSRVKLPWELQYKVKKGPSYNSSSGADTDFLALLQIEASKKEIEFFKKWYEQLSSSYADSTLSGSILRHQNIIVTDDWQLVDSNSVYLKPKDVIVPLEFKGNFRLVHPDIASDKSCVSLLRKLRVADLTSDHLQDMIKTKEIRSTGQKWPSLTDEEKVKQILLFQNLWARRLLQSRDLSFLTLKAKSGKWFKPEQMIFPTEYPTDIRIEELKEKGLFDLRVEFVSAEFITNSQVDPLNWLKFFGELGVGKPVEDRQTKKDFVARIATRMALKYEEKRTGTAKAHELTRTEEIGGYDITTSQQESEDEGVAFIQSDEDERFIEVKGSAKPNPDMFLTSRQFSTLQEKGENYYVYVVSDCLRNPNLAVTRGDRLQKITEIKVIIPYAKWWNQAREEEFRLEP